MATTIIAVSAISRDGALILRGAGGEERDRHLDADVAGDGGAARRGEWLEASCNRTDAGHRVDGVRSDGARCRMRVIGELLRDRGGNRSGIRRVRASRVADHPGVSACSDEDGRVPDDRPEARELHLERRAVHDDAQRCVRARLDVVDRHRNIERRQATAQELNALDPRRAACGRRRVAAMTARAC